MNMWTAKNFLEFCIDTNGLNIKPWARQLETGIKVLGEWCPSCSTDPYWFHKGVQVDTTITQIKRNVQLLEHGKCPKCMRSRQDLIHEGWIKDYEEVVNAPGQRSGGTTLASMLAAYLTHHILLLNNPQDTFNLPTPPSDSGCNLLGTFVESTYKMAQSGSWENFHNLISNSPWFESFHQQLKNLRIKFKFKKTFISYPHQGLMLGSSNTRPQNIRGTTRIFAFTTNLRTTNKVKETIYGLDNSLRTVRWKGKDLPFSVGLLFHTTWTDSETTWYKNCTYKDLLGIDPQGDPYISNLPTVECNPLAPPETIPVDQHAIRDYGPKKSW